MTDELNDKNDGHSAGDGGQDAATGTGAGAADKDAPASFSAEQQKAIDKLVADRLKRERDKMKAEAEAQKKADADEAEAKRLQEQQQWQELAQRHEAKAKETAGQVTELQARVERADAVIAGLLESRKQGLPEAMVKVLENRDLYDQLELVNAFLEATPPPQANGQSARQPAAATPPAQGTNTLTPEERRARAARTF